LTTVGYYSIIAIMRCLCGGHRLIQDSLVYEDQAVNFNVRNTQTPV